MNPFGVPVTRGESPRAFWFATGLSVATATVGLIVSVGAFGHLTGWWRFVL